MPEFVVPPWPQNLIFQCVKLTRHYRQIHCLAPPQCWFRLTIHGSCRGEPGHIGAGGVLSNEKWEWGWFKGSSLNLGIGSALGADRAMKLRRCLCLTRNDVDRLKLNVTLVLLSSWLFDPIEINHPLFNLVKIAK